MFYKELEAISNERQMISQKALLEEIDKWLFFLPNSQKRRFTQIDFVKKYDIPIGFVSEMFKQLSINKIFTEKYIVCCSECNQCTEMRSNLEDMEDLLNQFNRENEECDFCDSCCEWDFSNVYSVYSLSPLVVINEAEKEKYYQTFRTSGVVNYGLSVESQFKNNPESFDEKDANRLRLYLNRKH